MAGTTGAAVPVTLQPGTPVTMAPVPATAITGPAWFINDNTAGLNASAGSEVELSVEATQDGINWYQRAACTISPASPPQPSSGLAVTPAAAETHLRLVATLDAGAAAPVALSVTPPAAAAV